jgi:hypothetical protein
MIRAISGKGVNRARAVCDRCGREEVVTCDYARKPGRSGWVPNEGQVTRKMTGQGWAVVKGKLHCPGCEAKRKVTPMAEVQAKSRAAAVPQPTREQKRAIIDLLQDSYDTKAGRYLQGETDTTLAAVLDLRPGWVAALREELFGPDGRNEEADALRQELENLRAAITAGEAAHAEMRKALDAQGETLSSLRGQAEAGAAKLTRLLSAVGGHVLRRAGL